MYAKRKLIFLLYLFFINSHIEAVVIKGNDTTNPPFGFTTPIATTTYNTFTGSFIVGLAGSGDLFNISIATRPNFLSAPQFTPVLSATTNLKTNPVEFLALQDQTAVTPVVGVVEQTGASFTTNILSAVRINGTQETATAPLNDATGLPSEGITNLASGGTNFFAPVRPTAGNFGDVGSGISLIGVGDTNVLSLNIRNATTGLPGNQAIALNNTSVQLTGGTAPVTFQGGDALNITPVFYDTVLDRLYIGTQISTGGAAGNIAKSITVGQITQFPANALELTPIAPNSAIDLATAQQQLVAAINNGTVQPLTAIQLSVLHASTGPDYLIVYGGNGTFDTTTNNVWALPVVNSPSQPTIQGTLANKNSPLVQGKFIVPAAAPGDLALTTDSAALVGAQPLTLIPPQQINQLTAQGDTVYVSINLAPSTTNETGLFFSQAVFGPDGKIIRWTPWARALVFHALANTTLPGDTTYNGAVAGFAIDNSTGNIIFTEGTTDKIVDITTFNTGVVLMDLPSQLNQQLCTGSYSVLDLNQATRGFLSTTSSRYALFGGTNKIVFTQTSKAFDETLPNSSQLVITDYSNPANFLVTNLPAPGGSASVLEYSRATNNDNYFFAGTDNGLYVYAQQTGNGFNASQFGDLNLPPFDTARWIKVTSIPGAIIDIKTTGNGNLYIINSTVLSSSPFLQNTVYSIPFQATVQTMFDPSNIRIIAQSGQSIFAMALSFNGIQLIATNNPTGIAPESKEQLILATSQGVYATNASQSPGNGITDALNELMANWQIITPSQTIFFNGVAGINTPIRQTVFPFGLIDDPRQCELFDLGIIEQLSGDGNTGGTMAQIGTFVPSFFISLTNGIVLPPITYFYTDGSRRYFVFKQPQDGPMVNSLGVLPYNNAQFNMTSATILSPTFFNNQRYYWVSLIGDTGYLMLGTGMGVLALS